MDAPSYTEDGALKVHRADLEKITDMLPPQTEMRVLSIMREARYEIIVLNPSDDPGIYEIARSELDYVVDALRQRGAKLEMPT